MALSDVVDHWGTTPAERERPYPCDALLPDDAQALYRGITVDAPPSVVFRWLCQLKVAPYSYDLIDNLGRRSPHELVPGVEHLEVGQRVLIFELASFAVDEHLTVMARGHRVFGDVAITYAVAPEGRTGADGGAPRTRLLAKLLMVPVGGPAGAVLRRVLPLGDLVMMRRQLLNLKARAEHTAAAAVVTGD